MEGGLLRLRDEAETNLEALDKVLARDNVHRVQSLGKLELLGNLGRRRLDLHRKDRGGRTGTVRVEEQALADLRVDESRNSGSARAQRIRQG